ncbi:MAG: tellurite resistance TerB C-terminal domain-containing protein [Cyanobacteria bacterium J06639_18]
MVSNRFIINIVAFGISFGLSLALTGSFKRAAIIALLYIPTTYIAVLFAHQRRKQHDTIILKSLKSLNGQIREMEDIKSRMVVEINSLEKHRSLLYSESKQLQNQVAEYRHQRDSIDRELSTYAGQKKQAETGILQLKTELENLDKTKDELEKYFSKVTTESRRLEINCNVSRSEFTKIKNQIEQLEQDKKELENNLTLLNRVKPQLEEKLYDLRINLQELEVVECKKNETIRAKVAEQQSIEDKLSTLREEVDTKQVEFSQLKGQVSLLQDEHDILQDQIYDLLQQMENLNSNHLLEQDLEEQDLTELEDLEPFPFADLLDPLETTDEEKETEISTKLPQEWKILLEQLPEHEVRVLQALVEEENPNPIVKNIAQNNITMPNLLIDSINERASDTLGELIIDPGNEFPGICEEHLAKVQKMIEIYSHKPAKQGYSN